MTDAHEDTAGIASGLAVRQLLGAMGALAIGFASPLADRVWQAQGPAIGRVAFFAAAILAAGTLVTAIVGGFVESAKRSDDRPVPKIGSPQKPAMLPRQTKATTARRARRGRCPMDILVQAVDRLGVMLYNAKEAIRTVSINVLRTVAYVIWKLVINLVNLGCEGPGAHLALCRRRSQPHRQGSGKVSLWPMRVV